MRNVRRAEPGDATRLAELRYHFRAGEDPAVEPRAEFLERCESWMRDRLDPADGRWRCWVAGKAPRVVGHVWVQRVLKVPNPVEEAEAHAYLTNTYVQPASRGHGIGTELVEVALTWCRREGVDSVILWPTERSRPLYRRFGFGPAGGVWELSLREGGG